MAGSSTPRDVLSRLESGQADPVYLLLGDDAGGKTPLIEAFARLVDADLQGFNLQRFHATDTPLAGIVAAARTLPFLGGRRVVVVLRAEAALKPKARQAARGDAEAADAEVSTEDQHELDATAAGLVELEHYLESPSPETCLVLVASDINRSTRLGRLLPSRATVVEFWGLMGDRDPRRRGAVASALDEAARYAERRVRQAGTTIEAGAIERLVAHAGTDIGVLRADLERLLTYCAGRGRVSEDDVRAVVGGAVSHDDWAVTGSIERGDTAQALRDLALLLDGGASPYAVIGQLGWFVRAKMPGVAPARVREAVREVFETDLALKTSRADPQVLLERLVVRLCGEGRQRPAGTAQRFRRG